MDVSANAGRPETGGPLARASLLVEPGSVDGGTTGVAVRGLAAELMRLIREVDGDDLRSVLRIRLADALGSTAGCRGMSGYHEVLEDGLRFVPHFPFDRGLAYEVVFDADGFDGSVPVSFRFSLPREDAEPATVTAIFPSGDELPENLLRFYIWFSGPMRRGNAQDAIVIIGPDGQPVSDVLYRPPVELWDVDMRRLTVLLDPGRLKRQVGPNRALGPPLTAGGEYLLVIGAAMTDIHGHHLAAPVRKRFLASDAVRTLVETCAWQLVPPVTGSRKPLTLDFPSPMDQALLATALAVATIQGDVVDGTVVVENGEKLWSFTPTTPWAAGAYVVTVSSHCEDVCGNGVTGAFDRPLRREPAASLDDRVGITLPFVLLQEDRS